jgi:8-oxo-dGTP pyrophosphatase MutT (NUDIX family)
VEPDEEGMAAALREAYEEGGANLEDIRYIGCYQISDGSTTTWAEAFTAKVTSLTDIPVGSESLERKLVNVEELPDCYHSWDDLAKAVFEHSREIFER